MATGREISILCESCGKPNCKTMQWSNNGAPDFACEHCDKNVHVTTQNWADERRVAHHTKRD